MAEFDVIPSVRMSPQRATAWRRKYCRRQASFLWGKKRIITPVLVPILYGDGKQALALRPIITRRQYFILAIDSSVEVGKGEVHDFIDQVYVDIENLFGSCGCCECGGHDDEKYDIFKQWPTPCLNGGCEWWRIV